MNKRIESNQNIDTKNVFRIENAIFQLREYLNSIKYYTTIPPSILKNGSIEISVYPMLHQIVKVVCLNFEFIELPY